ncbi:amidase [Nostocoides sp. HKS02]|uniref:amidase n=1 Tax=Nostocoides sp. HKS02 TaxID=1813880 RepID=UPI0012B4EE93|nr:amidase [Tetrasphaera sp. HKS02]QGN58828.1 amidase [Tetrasphaera sp. HKS02]
MSQDLFFESAVELAGRLRNKDVSAVEVSEAFLRRIDAENPRVNAFTTVTHDLALETARRLDARAASGQPLGVLHGLPVAIKDLFDLRAGVRSTFGSVPLRNHVPQQTALYVQRLEDAGAVIVGKTNAPEFGHKGVTDNLVSGPTRNPFDLSRNAGGSSGGAAAAVAAGMVPLAQGTDGGGSVRIPASWCGVYGIKPSFGRVADVSRPDAFISSSPFVSVGPLARGVADAALMLAAMAGPHARDPFSLPASMTNLADVARGGLHGKRVAFSPDLGGFPVDPAVSATIKASLIVLEQAGAVVEEIAFKLPADQLELAALWNRLMGVLYSDSFEAVKQWGTDILADHLQDLTPAFRTMVVAAQSRTAMEARADERLRTTVLDAVEDALEGYDFLVSPTLAVTAVANRDDGHTTGPSTVEGVQVDPSIGWCLTYPFNFTGHPAASVPAGFVDGLPVGLQIVGHRHDDAGVLAASAAFEAHSPWQHTYPGWERS